MSESRIRAPELPDVLEWVNCDAPVRIADQRGKVVLLDFWTYCCINCLHVLPDLHYLEQKYPDGLTVIGLHSPKFPNEKVTTNVLKAVNRSHIRHPVANDPTYTVWRQYGVRAWPTIIFIDPEGYVVGALPGEGRRRQLDRLIQEHLQAAEERGLRRHEPVAVCPRPEPRGPLSFPGKVHAAGGRVYVSDSGHNRVLELRADGSVVRAFGSGSLGLLDGRLEESSFNDPQGLVRVDEHLFVADTGNHSIRRIDLLHGGVQTVAGTGEQGRYAGDRFTNPLKAALNSPLDLVYDNGSLYIAMAGQHQIWRLNLRRNVIEVLAGSGREDLADGPLRSAALAQPSGLALAGGRLYVADSESSAIRVIELGREWIETIVGTGLFEFGDADGTGLEAKLQHPQGVAADAARRVLWIADTFNHKIKRLDLTTREVCGLDVGERMIEPGGISVEGDALWVANTNDHNLLRIDLAHGDTQAVEVAPLAARRI